MLNLKENRFYKLTKDHFVRICYYQNNILHELFYFRINENVIKYGKLIISRHMLTQWTEQRLLSVIKSISIVEINMVEVLKLVSYETLLGDFKKCDLKYIPFSVSDTIQDLITKLEQNDSIQK